MTDSISRAFGHTDVRDTAFVTVQEEPPPGWPSNPDGPTVRLESDHYVAVDCSSWDEHAIMRALDYEHDRGWRLICAEGGAFVFERIRE